MNLRQLLLLLLLFSTALSCVPQQSSSDDDAADDDVSADNDVGDDDVTDDDVLDDDAVDDDVVDDDSTDDDADDDVDDDSADDDAVDDDTTDDDAIDDDTTDDDAVDDDAVDDDTTDDDAIDDDTTDDDSVDDDTASDYLDLQFIDGAPAGSADTILKIAPDGTKYVLAQRVQALFLYTLPLEPNYWVVTTLANHATEPDLAIDESGQLHVVYYDVRTKDLIYGTNAAGSWNWQQLDSVGDVGQGASVAVDLTGSVHVAYYDRTNGDLKYAQYSDNTWHMATLDTSGNVGADTDIATDQGGHMHIVYRSVTDASVKYITNLDGDWQITTVESGVATSGQTSIAVQSSGEAHLSYFVVKSNYHGTWHYATNADGNWFAEEPEPNYAYNGEIERNGQYNTLLLDADNRPNVAHGYVFDGYSSLTCAVSVAVRENGQWTDNTADQGHMDFSEPWGVDYSGPVNSLAIDSAGALHLVYWHSQDEGWAGLRQAVNSGSSWSKSFVTTIGGNCAESVLALDEDGNPYVAYQSDRDLYHASNLGAGWNVNLSAEGSYYYYMYNREEMQYGLSTSIAYTSSGPAISSMRYSYYYEGDEDNMLWWEHALCLGPGDGVLDINGCGETAIAADPAGSFKIAYYPAPFSSGPPWLDDVSATTILIYGYPTSETAVTDAEGRVALKIDADSKMHLVYHATDDTVKYATNRSGAWVAEVVDTLAGPGGATISLILDEAGYAHVGYCDKLNQTLKYATNESGTWEAFTVTDSFDTNTFLSLALDSRGYAYIAYYDYDNSRAQLATNETGSWVSRTLASKNAGYYIQLAIDGFDQAHVVLVKNAAVYYATFPIDTEEKRKPLPDRRAEQ